MNYHEAIENEQVQMKSKSEPIFKEKKSKGKNKAPCNVGQCQILSFQELRWLQSFRCSFYESEGCNASIKAKKMKMNGGEQLKMEAFKDHEKLVYDDALIVDDVDRKGEAKTERKSIESKTY